MTGNSRLTTFALIGLLLVAGPIACGKRGSLEVPENRRSEFTYPKQYPAPQSVVPSLGTADEEAGAAEEPGLRQRKSKVSTFPGREDETTVYGPASSE